MILQKDAKTGFNKEIAEITKGQRGTDHKKITPRREDAKDGRSRFADNEDFSAVGLRVMGSLGPPFPPVPKNTARESRAVPNSIPLWVRSFSDGCD